MKMEENNILINVRINEKKYEDFSLNNISFSADYGEVIALLGPNGNGKSTIIKCILDIISFDGEISIMGEKVGGKNEGYKENIGVVFDDFCFNLNLNIYILEKILSNLYANWDREVFYDYIERFNLPKNKIFKKFSKGMKMKTLIAIALSHNAKLLVMDEPTSGLDPLFRREFKKVLKEYIDVKGATLFFSTHITGDIEKFADRIIIVKNGTVVIDKKYKKLMESYVLFKGNKSDFKKYKREEVYVYSEKNDECEALLKREETDYNESQYFFEASLEDIVAALCGNGKE